MNSLTTYTGRRAPSHSATRVAVLPGNGGSGAGGVTPGTTGSVAATSGRERWSMTATAAPMSNGTNSVWRPSTR